MFLYSENPVKKQKIKVRNANQDFPLYADLHIMEHIKGNGKVEEREKEKRKHLCTWNYIEFGQCYKK